MLACADASWWVQAALPEMSLHELQMVDINQECPIQVWIGVQDLFRHLCCV